MYTSRTIALLSFILSMIIIVPCFASFETVEGEFIIKFKDTVSTHQQKAFINQNQIEIVKSFKLLPNTSLIRSKTVHSPLKGSQSSHALITTLKQASEIEYIEPNYIVHAIDISKSSGIDCQYGLEKVNAPNAWHISKGDSKIIVAILDSGIDLTHPDLQENIWINKDEIPDNGKDDDNNGYIDDQYGWDWAYDDKDPSDYDGHGTHCAGIIGAINKNQSGVSGVCPQITLMPLKFLDNYGSGSVANAILALEYAVMMGAKITSNSWGGGGYSTSLKEAIARSNLLFFAAAGNESSNSDQIGHYPSAFDLDNIIAVAATDKNDLLSVSSNYGLNSVDIGAPGVNILSTKPNNPVDINFGLPGCGLSDDYYGVISGTSMATPFVSGAAALLYASNPMLTGSDIKDILLETVDPVQDLENKTRSGGRLNVYKALSYGASNFSVIPKALDFGVVSLGKTKTMSLYLVNHKNSLVTVNLLLNNPSFSMDKQSAIILAGTKVELKVTFNPISSQSYQVILKCSTDDTEIDVTLTGQGQEMAEFSLYPDTLSFQMKPDTTQCQQMTLDNIGPIDLNWRIPMPNQMSNSKTIINDVLQNTSPFYTQANRTSFFEGFESGDFSQWIIDIGSGIKKITNETASEGLMSFYYQNTWSSMHLHGIHKEFESETHPQSIEFDIRSGSSMKADAYVVLSKNKSYEFIVFFANDNGKFYINDDVSGNTNYYYKPFTWYHISLKEFDWMTKQFNFYVNNELIKSNISFRNKQEISELNEMYLYNYDESEAWWDNIRIDQSINWLTIEPNSGELPPGNQTAVNVCASSNQLSPGFYEKLVLQLYSNSENSPLTIPVSIQITGIQIKPNELQFDALSVGESQSLTVYFHNYSQEDVFLQLSTDAIVFSSDQESLFVAKQTTQTVLVTFTPIDSGEFEGFLMCQQGDTIQKIALKGIGIFQPVIQIEPHTLSFVTPLTKSQTQDLTLNNSGKGPLEWKLSMDILNNQESTISKDMIHLSSKPLSNGLPFIENFETDLSKWRLDWGLGIKEITDTTAADGTHSFYYYSKGYNAHNHGIHTEFSDIIQPDTISFKIRSGSTNTADAYVRLSYQDQTIILFFAKSNGNLYINADVGGDNSFTYNAFQWYFIELKNINWQLKTFDYYIDGNQIKTNISFRNQSIAKGIDTMSLYNFHMNSQAWWDSIRIQKTQKNWVQAKPQTGLIAPGKSQIIHMTATSKDLDIGFYQTTLYLYHNAPNYHSPYPIEADLHVIQNQPSIAIIPKKIDMTLVQGQSSQSEIILENNGPLTLQWKASIKDTTSNAQQNDMIYTISDSRSPKGPSFSWQDMSQKGVRIQGLKDDNYVGPFPIGFSFRFFDQEYSEFYICSNGYIGFGPPLGYATRHNKILPTSIPPNTIIAWCWDDLLPSEGQTYSFQDNNRLIVQFSDYQEYKTSYKISAQVVLSSDGAIMLQYNNIDPLFPMNNYKSGIEDHTGTKGITISSSLMPIENKVAILMSRLSQTQWLDITPITGHIEQGEKDKVQLMVHTENMEPGIYQQMIVIDSNDPIQPQIICPITLTLDAISPQMTTYHLMNTNVSHSKPIQEKVLNHSLNSFYSVAFSSKKLMGYGKNMNVIQLDSIPPYGNRIQNLKGSVLIEDYQSYSIEVLIYQNGWYNKPSEEEPITLIHPDGTWMCDITTEQWDYSASHIAIFLLPTENQIVCHHDAYIPELLYQRAISYIIISRIE